MRLVIARCSVDYIGRFDAHLPMADRLIMVKADGSVSVHADDRAYKPLNWMTPPCTVTETPITDMDGAHRQVGFYAYDVDSYLVPVTDSHAMLVPADSVDKVIRMLRQM